MYVCDQVNNGIVYSYDLITQWPQQFISYTYEVIAKVNQYAFIRATFCVCLSCVHDCLSVFKHSSIEDMESSHHMTHYI